MKLVHRVLLTFIIPIVLLLGLWGWLSYRTMVDKIYNDMDVILSDYAEGIISGKLSGQELPERFNGVYNTYYLREVTPEYAEEHDDIVYSDAEVMLRNQHNLTSSRTRTQVFKDSNDVHYELTVSLPAFESDVLVHHVLGWTLLLFVVLLFSVVVVSLSVLNYNLRPFYRLLKWIDRYVPGVDNGPIPDCSDVDEFNMLASAVCTAVDRIEGQYEDRKLFIGNVSHELQTPLAACINRIEMLLESHELADEVAAEMVKVLRSLQGLARLNKTLLLLTKIENEQFSEKAPVDFSDLIKESVEMHSEMYAHKEISCDIVVNGELKYDMNGQMAPVLVNNLLKNAFVHSPGSSVIHIHIDESGFVIRNRGARALDASRIFRRFYLPDGKKEGSSGLGLSLCYAVCRHSNLEILYNYSDGHHEFAVNLKN